MRDGSLTEAAEAVRRAYIAREPALVWRYAALRVIPSPATLYRHAAALRSGHPEALLSGVVPRHDLRRSRRLGGDLEARYRAQLTEWLIGGGWRRPVQQLIGDLARYATARGLAVPAESWVRRTVFRLRRDAVIGAKAQHGKRWKWYLSHSRRDWSGILPGQMYVCDNRQADRLVIARDGRVIRPWIVRIDDGLTGVPMAVNILESAANADAILVALAMAFRPKPDSSATRHLDLSAICGVPEVIYMDNGKDYTDQRMTGVVVDERGKVKALDAGERRKLRQSEMTDIETAISRLYGELQGGEPGATPHVIYGIPAELGTRVIRARPYNSRAKTVERSFRDDSLGFDSCGVGVAGNTPDQRTDNAREIAAHADRMRRDGKGIAEIAAATGLWTIDEFRERYTAWLFEWAQREDSQSERLLRDGRRWSPLGMFQAYAEKTRAIPSDALLRKLFVRRKTLTVQRGYVAWTRVSGEGKTWYRASELVRLSGKRVIIEYSPLDDSTIDVVGVCGCGANDPLYGIASPIRVAKYAGVPAIASSDEIAEIGRFAKRDGHAAAAHLAALTARAESVDPIIELSEQIKARNAELPAARRRGETVGGIGYTVIDVAGEPEPATPAEEVAEEEKTSGRKYILYPDEQRGYGLG